MEDESRFQMSSVMDVAQAVELRRILTQSFSFFAGGWEVYLQRIGGENFRLLHEGGKVVAALALYRMGQWFGGRSVPMAGVAAVGVPPELRGTGLSLELMRRTLQDLATEGIPLSVLFPATQVPYRKAGYEQAGFSHRYSMSLSRVQMRDRDLELRPVDPTAHEAFYELYQRWASIQCGLLDRNKAVWERVVLPRNSELRRAYLIGPPGAEEGYFIYHNEPTPNGLYDLHVSDLVTLSGSALRRVWTFFADHRSMSEKVVWSGGAADPALYLLPEQGARIANVERWMLRILDVAKALEQRGYPPGASGELHLEVRDALLPRNQGRFVLKVEGGSGTVSEGGEGRMGLDIRGLATLYSGLYTPVELHALGRLTAPAADLQTALGLFAGPQPWMPDHF